MTLADTKERLLDAAERLFAAEGFAATSLRDITAAADANLASVNYHFGGKEGLLEAIFERRLAPVNRERLRLLARLRERAQGAPALEEVLWAFLEPPFRAIAETGEGGRHFMRIAGRMHSDPVRWGAFFERQFDAVAERFRDAFVGALPELPAEEVVRRMHYLIGAMAHTFCWAEAMCPLGARLEGDAKSTLHSLLRFAASGMRAPAKEVEIPDLADLLAPEEAR